ncbi:MAG: hypothetical protein L3J89_07520 [Gammaproteobacteria bacterium]|nr:hypothetical protein [Gammaproteobacteria bacterium]
MSLFDGTLFEQVLLTIFVATLFCLMLSLVFILIMHILMPKKVLKAYFKEPYFNAGEIAMFTGFPFGYMRTAMFSRVLGFPASGKKRGLENAYQLAPVWYCKISKYFLYFFVPNLALLVISVVIVFIHFEAWKQ